MQAIGLLRKLGLKNRPVHFVHQRQYAKKKKVEYRPVTLNDLPSPEGDFYTQNNARQKMNNVHLVLGIGSLILTIVFGVVTDKYVFFNEIPDPPAEIDCYK